jgi:hypothetical protein
MILSIAKVILQVIIINLLFLKINYSLPYGEFKFERQAFKILLPLNERHIFYKS